MATSRDQVAAVLGEVFPVSEGELSYEFVSIDSDCRITVRLLVFETAADGTRSIRDIKEQELYLFGPELLQGDTPILELLRGWGDALREVFSKAKRETIEYLMPHDLAPGDAIRLRRATTAAEYRDALLKKSRLGKFLG